MYPNTYNMDEWFDYGEVINRMETLNDKIEEELGKDNVDRKKVNDLAYAKFIQGLRLNTGYVNLWGK